VKPATLRPDCPPRPFERGNAMTVTLTHADAGELIANDDPDAPASMLYTVTPERCLGLFGVAR
jgi:hypothetical protein